MTTSSANLLTIDAGPVRGVEGVALKDDDGVLEPP